MIDSHCHLEQKDYDSDRDEVIENLKKELKAVVTCCAHPKDFNLTIQLTEKHKNFVFATVGIHPIYIKEISKKEVDNFINIIKQNKDKIVGIGEIGLDYSYIKKNAWKEKQKELFIKFINLSKELKKPLVIHCREAFEDAIEILENQNAKQVLMHLFGAKNLLERVKNNNWYISIGPIIKRSKSHKKIARDFPLDKILLETDSPWFGNSERGISLNIKIPAQKISEVKKIPFEEVWKKCGENSIKFFSLNIPQFLEY